MRKIQVILLDDIDGSDAERTVQFAVDGASYEIDLSKANIAKFEDALAPFIEKATKVGSRSSGRGRSRGAAGGRTSKAAEVRVWARAQGIDVPDRGRVPNDILEKYDAAH